jgi:hypothetical protein
MTQTGTRTLTRFLIEEQRLNNATGNFTALLNDIRLACDREPHRQGPACGCARQRRLGERRAKRRCSSM